MVESDKYCVLQWADHAKYITEKFSGLLARQVLVDVTLVCEEQKLRVHKLVLASNSTYFEVCLKVQVSINEIHCKLILLCLQRNLKYVSDVYSFVCYIDTYNFEKRYL